MLSTVTIGAQVLAGQPGVRPHAALRGPLPRPLLPAAPSLRARLHHHGLPHWPSQEGDRTYVHSDRLSHTQ